MQRNAKRMLDITGAGSALLVALPIGLLVTALVLWSSPGPALTPGRTR